jgi:hypothetical protein
LRRVDFQHLEDKMDGKVPTWHGKYINMPSRTALMKLSPLELNNMKKTERWQAICKVNWEIICCPRILVASVCYVLTNSQELFGCDDLGLNGRN